MIVKEEVEVVKKEGQCGALRKAYVKAPWRSRIVLQVKVKAKDVNNRSGKARPDIGS